jgi:hypothetical protein
MAKVTRKEVPQVKVEYTYVLELDEEEAAAIAALCGRNNSGIDNKYAKAAGRVFNVLRDKVTYYDAAYSQLAHPTTAIRFTDEEKSW